MPGEVDREPFVAALVDHLREASFAMQADGGEELFYAAKQRLLDDESRGRPG